MDYQENINHIQGIEKEDDYEIHKLQVQGMQVPGLMGEYSFSIILPKSFVLDIGFKKGDYLKIYKKADALVIKKA